MGLPERNNPLSGISGLRSGPSGVSPAHMRSGHPRPEDLVPGEGRGSQAESSKGRRAPVLPNGHLSLWTLITGHHPRGPLPCHPSELLVFLILASTSNVEGPF